MRRNALAALLRKDLTPGDVHVPGVDLSRPKGKKQRLLNTLRGVEKGTDPGLYICRRLTADSYSRFASWWLSTTRFPLDSDLHVTLAHSRVTFPWQPDMQTLTVPRNRLSGYTTLGACTVLRFKSPALQRRWEQTKAAGAIWDYPQYLPHMSLCAGAEPGRRTLPPLPPFDLEFGPEELAPLKIDKSEDPAFLDELAAAVHESWWAHNEHRENEHCVPFAELDVKAKNVDRDAVRAVLAGLVRLGVTLSSDF